MSFLWSIINFHLLLFSIFLQQLIIVVELFHCYSCRLFRNSLLMFSRITLFVFTISFFAELITLGCIIFKILFMVFVKDVLLIGYFLPFLLIVLVVVEFAFLKVLIIELCRSCSTSIWLFHKN